MRFDKEFYDVEHEGDIEQVTDAIRAAGGTVENIDHNYDAETLIVTIKCTDEDYEKISDIEWMEHEVPIDRQGDGLGGSFY
ncbi:MAG: hypothetical protein H8D23_16745 [Candidatus Brocadiales bacterium]|nr:hypothetical protein [Candidatus Brocadiales bacterium]